MGRIWPDWFLGMAASRGENLWIYRVICECLAASICSRLGATRQVPGRCCSCRPGGGCDQSFKTSPCTQVFAARAEQGTKLCSDVILGQYNCHRAVDQGRR